MSYTLISDIGGTNIRLSIKGAGILYNDFTKVYKCKDFKNIEDALLSYLNNIDSKFFPHNAILAVAAPIAGDFIKFSNNHWFFSIKDLEKKTAIKNIKVVNDFEAQAYSLEFLTKNDVITLEEAKTNKENGRKLILGPGTGLGVSLVVKDETTQKWNVFSTEAGHIILGAYSSLEQKVLAYLQQALNKESFAELVISGYGICNIYKALCYLTNVEYNSNINAKQIVENALNSSSKNCTYKQTLDLFFNFFASFVSSMAVAFLPYNGIYITGGIIPKLIPQIKASGFLIRYKQRALEGVVNILNNIEINIITVENPALLGLAKRDY